MSDEPGGAPRWPDDVLYLPVAPADADDPKGPDTSRLSTWGPDGTGCVTHDETDDSRWGVVDVGVGGYRLLIVDLDIYKLEGDEKQTALDGLEKAPETRIHESQSGGLHAFYWIKESELENGKLPVTFTAAIDDKLNGYVLSAEHCAGYAAREDRQPTEIVVDDIPDEWIKASVSPSEPETPPTADNTDVPSVYDVLTVANHPPGERTGHPLGPRHSGGGKSSTGSNFMVDEDGETWRCWRHDTTGNALHLVGMEEGIFDCGDWDHGGVSTDQWRAVFEAAEERGLVEPTEFDPEERHETAHAIEAQDHYESIEAVTFPDEANFVLDKPPREGGSYATITHFLSTPKSMILLAPRHAILEYHVETVASVLDDDECVVHLRGQQHVCDNPNDCDKYPESYDELLDYRNEVTDLMHRKQAITAEDCPEGICTYWFLKAAAERSRVALTVPQLLPRLDREFEELNLMVDEEQTLSFFQPGSVELLELGEVWETDGTRTIQLLSANIKSEYRTLEEIREQIHQDQQERNEEAQEEGRDWRRLSHEIDVCNAIDTVEALLDALGVESAVEELGDDASLQDVVERLETRLEEIELPEPRTDPDKLIEEIANYCAPYFWTDEANPSALLEAILFPYDDNTFHFKRAGSTYKLRLIGDKEGVTFYQDQLAEFNQIGLIAGPEGERFLESVSDAPETIVIDEFRYAEDFVVVPVGKYGDDEMEPVMKQRNRASRVSQRLNRRNLPHIAVAGTTDQAHGHAEDLAAEGAAVIGDPESPAISLSLRWSAGQTAVIYENSVVSRGIDVPFFDITVITSPGFATPYWEARKDRYKGEDDEQYAEARAVEEELKARELTNAALRMAPTRGVEDIYGTKFIVAAASDVKRLKYLQERTLPMMRSVGSVTDALDVLTASGDVRVAAEQVYDELGGSEKEYIEVFSKETIKPKRQARPAYTLEELSNWIDENHVTDRDYVYRVLRKIEQLGQPKTEEVVERVPSMTNARVRTALSILESKGVVKKVDSASEGRGRSPKRWVLTGTPI